MVSKSGLKTRQSAVIVNINPGWHTALDLKNLLTVSEAITRGALERKESRGAQFRDDYPDKDEQFCKSKYDDLESRGWSDADSFGTLAGNAGLFEANHRGDEMTRDYTDRADCFCISVIRIIRGLIS